MKPLIIRKEEIVTLLDSKEIISVIENSFFDFFFKKTIMPSPQDIIIKEFNGETHVKSSYIEGNDSYCIKIASGFYDNPKLGLNSSQGMMILLNSKTGIPKTAPKSPKPASKGQNPAPDKPWSKTWPKI